ncbi:MAG: hypothetical protein FJX46_02540 [Alphaproteobacteria bacterium]|nr:hypothetical protein [Alphaproteobacteria bacterium]
MDSPNVNNALGPTVTKAVFNSEKKQTESVLKLFDDAKNTAEQAAAAAERPREAEAGEGRGRNVDVRA